MAEPILLDCDPGHDDAIAILLALASPEVELLGITTVQGNQTVEKTTANAIRILEFVGRIDVPVAAGAGRPFLRDAHVARYVHGESGLDGPALPPAQGSPIDEHAVDFLGARADGVTLVAVGPLTNVALMLARFPDVRPARIVLMGGSIGVGNVTPAAEFNIWADPEAAARVFGSGLDVTMIGLDATHQALMTRTDADRLRETGRAGGLVSELWEFYNRFHSQTYDFDGSPIHDALALAYVFRPELVETVRRHVAVDCGSDLSRGRTLVDLWRRTGQEPNASVGVNADGRAFIELLVERLPTLD
ncbi:MAG TPA: nucleoside hydrolase [Gaiellaceae bacterium]|nr:nucleoside hydrolase [Gaiellaceae bacterium]